MGEKDGQAGVFHVTEHHEGDEDDPRQNQDREPTAFRRGLKDPHPTKKDMSGRDDTSIIVSLWYFDDFTDEHCQARC